MKWLQFYRRTAGNDIQQMLGSDGVLWLDKRFGKARIIREGKEHGRRRKADYFRLLVGSSLLTAKETGSWYSIAKDARER